MKDSKKHGKSSGKSKEEIVKHSSKKIKLLGINVTIKYVKNIIEEDGYKLGQTAWNGDKCIISIALENEDGSLSEECIKRTLLHELFHLAFSTLYYDEESKDEHLVEWLSSCFYDFIVKHKLIDYGNDK